MISSSASNRRIRRRRGGYSILELIVVILVLLVLALILIPIVANRASQARVARANADITNLAEAQARIEIDTGYYVRLHAINDTRRGESQTVGFNRSATPLGFVDGIGQYLIASQPWYGNAVQVFIHVSDDPSINGTLLSAAQATALLNKLVRIETAYDPLEPHWSGPYISFRRDDNLVAGVRGPDGIPDDPWGNNYLLFTSRGLVQEPNGTILPGASIDSNGNVQPGSFDARIFDRPTILSLGPDGAVGAGGIGGTTFGRGDDIMRQFGR
jgi:type II secretory pathway pseudopilin PulG